MFTEALGRSARNWDCYDAIVKTLHELEDDETLLVQSGKPVAVFKSHKDAPKVLIANSNLVPAWANWDTFHELDKKGLMMYGQMTAGSWIYIGSQGIVQGTYETFAELGRQHFTGSLKQTITLTAGLGGMGGAQPLAVTMNDGVCIAIDVDEYRIDRRLETKYLDTKVYTIEEAIKLATEAKQEGRPLSIGLLGNAAEILPKMLKMNFIPDVLTDQTSAHDPLNGYVPIGYSLEEADCSAEGGSLLNMFRNQKPAWLSMFRLCWICRRRAPLHLTTATISVRSQKMKASRMLLIFLDSCLPISVHYSAKEKGLSAG